jgi:hypothetical protein
MLELRPSCEACGKALPPNAADAMICTYECTFCADCVLNVLGNVCPNCGGNFERRPIRARNARKASHQQRTPSRGDRSGVTRSAARTLRRHTARRAIASRPQSESSPESATSDARRTYRQARCQSSERTSPDWLRPLASRAAARSRPMCLR